MRWRKLLILTAKVGLFALVVWGIWRTTASSIGELREQHWSPASLDIKWLAASAVLYLLSLVPPGLFWRRVLIAMGQEPGRFETVRAYIIGHLGKYVPGKALVIVLRAGLIRSSRVDTTVAAVSIFYETFAMMAIGAMVAGVVIAILFRQHTMLMLLAAGSAVFAGVPVWPPVFQRLARLFGVGRRNPSTLDKVSQLRSDTLIAGSLGLAFGWVLTGLALFATLRAGGYASADSTAHDVAVCIAAAALAIVAGFVSFIPGGAGVREFVLVELLAGPFGEAGALVSAVVARLLWLVAELVISVILYLCRSRQRAVGRGQQAV